MKPKLILIILVTLMLPLATATEIFGQLSTNPDFHEENNIVEPPLVQEPETSPSGSSSGGSNGRTANTNELGRGHSAIENTPTEETKDTSSSGRKVIVEGELKQVLDISLKETETASFNVDDETYSLQVKEITDNRITFSLGSTRDSLKISQVKEYDLDKNGFADISVFLAGITNGKAQLEINKLAEPLENSLTGAVTGVIFKSSWIYLGIFAVVVCILAGAGIYYKKRKR